MKILFSLAPVCAAAVVCSSANAQFYKLHNVDLSGGGVGEFTRTLNSNSSPITNGTSETVGGLFSIREHPFAFAGVEFNYSYSKFSEYYTATLPPLIGSYTARTQTDMHEATAAYLFHPHFRKFQPFVGVGGGAVDLVPVGAGVNQWRGAGLLEAGFDVPTSNPHFGFRVTGRTLYYRSPNYGQADLAARSWVVTTQPSLGVYYRF